MYLVNCFLQAVVVSRASNAIRSAHSFSNAITSTLRTSNSPPLPHLVAEKANLPWGCPLLSSLTIPLLPRIRSLRRAAAFVAPRVESFCGPAPHLTTNIVSIAGTATARPMFNSLLGGGSKPQSTSSPTKPTLTRSSTGASIRKRLRRGLSSSSHIPHGGSKLEKAPPGKRGVFTAAVDQGTTSSRFLIFDGEGMPRASHQVEFEQLYPHSG